LYRAKAEKSNKGAPTGGKTHRSKFNSDTLYLSYRRSSKSGLKKMASGSKTKLKKESSVNINNDTFQNHKSYLLKTDQKMTDEALNRMHSAPLQNPHFKNDQNDEDNQTIDSSRHSDNSYTTNLKEFLEAAANGNRDKLDRMLNFDAPASEEKELISSKITDIN
jgi:hypothetical protein